MNEPVSVLAVPMFDPGAGRIELTMPEGMNLAKIVRAALPQASADDLRQCRVTLVSASGASVIGRALWHAVTPKPGIRVIIRVVPGKGALRSILMVAVSIAAVALGQYWALGLGYTAGTTGFAVASSLITMGVNMVGSLLINALVPPVKPDDERRNSYSISGWRNRLDPDGAVPIVLGDIRYAPPFAAMSYTEVVGDWQYIRALFLFGEGELELSDFRLGETAIEEFDEIEMEIRQGLVGDQPVTLYLQQVLEESVGVELTRHRPRDDAGEIIDGEAPLKPVTRTTGRDTDRANIILAWPGGLLRFDKKGRRRAGMVQVQIEYREVGAPDWVNVTTLDIRAERPEQFYRYHPLQFPRRSRWEVRLTMLTVENTDSNVSDSTVWAGLQTIRPEYPIAYDRPLALVAMRVKATHQLNGGLANLTARARRICLDWDVSSATWVKRPTSNPASLYRYALQSAANPKAVTDAEIDLDQFADWHEFCAARSLHYNRVLDQAGASLRDALTEIAAVGRATPRHDGLRWGVVIDRPSDLIVDHVGPRNSWNFSVSRAYAEQPHALIVRFQDQTDDFKETQRVIRRPGHDGPINLTEVLQLPGITDPDVVYREGLRRFYEAQYRPDVFEVTQDGAARVATRGDTIALSHDVISTVQIVARVTAVAGNIVEIDEEVEISQGQTYGIRFRVFADADDTVGVSVVRPLAGEPGITRLLTLDGTGAAPHTGDLVYFGLAGREAEQVIVTHVERTEDMCSILRGVAAAPEIDALTDAAVIPEWDTRVGQIVTGDMPMPAPPRFTQLRSGLFISFGGGIRLGNADIEILLEPDPGTVPVTHFEIQHRRLGAPEWSSVSIPAGAGGAGLDGYPLGQTAELRARSWTAFGVASPFGPIVTITVGSNLTPPAELDPASISITPLLGGGLIQFATGTDNLLETVQLYRSRLPELDRSADAVGAALAVAPNQSYSFAIGDTTRANLASPAAWQAAGGWIVESGAARHAPGQAGTLQQPLLTTTGRHYRVAYRVSDQTAGTVTIRLAGTDIRNGPDATGAGYYSGKITADGHTRLELYASADFDGTVSDIVTYMETDACLAPGTSHLAGTTRRRWRPRPDFRPARDRDHLTPELHPPARASRARVSRGARSSERAQHGGYPHSEYSVIQFRRQSDRKLRW